MSRDDAVNVDRTREQIYAHGRRELQNDCQKRHNYICKAVQGENGMAKRKQSNIHIVLLAYFHRYGWIALMLLLMYFTNFTKKYVMGISSVAFSIWTFFGYLLRWKHIYCSYQNAYHEPMTPNHIKWSTVKKSDAYGTPAIFMILGVVLLLV